MTVRDEILALDRRHVWRPYTSLEDHATRDPLVIRAAEGAWLEDEDGRRYLDGIGSWWANTLGHRHPRIVEAVRAQAETLLHAPLADATHAEAARLAAELTATAPAGLTRAFFSDDGSTAVEAAIKMAHQYWQQNGRPARRKVVVLSGAFHGDTLGAVSAGGVEVFRAVFGALLFEVVRAPDPEEAGGWDRVVDACVTRIRREHEEIASVLVEPLVQGAAGMRLWPAEGFRALRAACTEADTFLIADEVFTGLGRTGAFWASGLAGATPDLLATAKGLSGSALPFAATLAAERVYEGFRGGRARAFLHGHTYCGNPLGARVAREVLAVYRDERVLEGVAERASRIARAMAAVPGGRQPRALGMVGAVDLAEGGYLSERGRVAADEARRLGAYLRPLGDTLYVAPPLNIPLAELDTLLEVFVASATYALAQGR